jgi:cytoskeletal protein CcmA (bactofilin family)
MTKLWQRKPKSVIVKAGGTELVESNSVSLDHLVAPTDNSIHKSEIGMDLKQDETENGAWKRGSSGNGIIEKISRTHSGLIEAGSSSAAPTIIRSGLHLQGNIRTTSDILLEGSIEGEVVANTVTIAAGAKLVGNVTASVIVVDGSLEGVVACVKLQVNTTGKVAGELHQRVLVVEAGASVEGSVFRTTESVVQDLSEPEVVVELFGPNDVSGGVETNSDSVAASNGQD